MAVYAMALKDSTDSNGIVFSTSAQSLEEAKEYFRQLKQLSQTSFNELFKVVEITKKQK
tara:strand:- start:1228 stop:1404 length:177 start_codon:yes stop_codon:yes gene_type:complete